MGRHVIFIRNPSSGSNFRTVNGSGSGSKKPPKGKQPPKPKTPQNMFPTPIGSYYGTGGAIYKSVETDWKKKHPNPSFSNIYAAVSGQGTYDPNAPEVTGIWGPEFIPPESLIQDFYDIFIAQVGPRGETQLPYGTPGTLVWLAGTDMGPTGGGGGQAPFWLISPAVAAATYHGIGGAFIPGELPNVGMAPNRYNARPWWTQYKQPKINYNPYWFLHGGTELDE